MWSWLFFVKVPRLVDNAVLGYFLAAVSFAIIVFVSSYIFIRLIGYLKRQYDHLANPGLAFLLKIFVLWAVCEWFVAWIVTFIWFGQNAQVDTAAPFASLTPLVMYTPFAFASRLFGYFGLSALTITIFASLLLPKLRKFAPLLVVVLVGSSLLMWAMYRTPNGQEITVTAASETLGDRPEISSDADLIVLPEYGLDQSSSLDFRQRIDSNNPDTHFVGSQQVQTPEGTQNVLIYGNSVSGFIDRQPKTRLVPAGEYLPYVVDVPLKITNSSEILTEFEYSRATIKGDSPIHPLHINDDFIVGAAICSSVIAPEDYRRLVNEGATILTNSASLEIFNGSAVFGLTHVALSRFMAIANARPLVQSAFDGPAFIMNHNGHTVAKADPVSTATANIETSTKKTPYSALGEWVVIIGISYALFLAIGVIYHRRLKR